MSLKDLIDIIGYTYEEISSMCGLDVETVIDCIRGRKPQNASAYNLILDVFDLDCE